MPVTLRQHKRELEHIVRGHGPPLQSLTVGSVSGVSLSMLLTLPLLKYKTNVFTLSFLYDLFIITTNRSSQRQSWQD
jgi:hypothetical protein